METPLLEFRNITVLRQEKKILDNINLTVGPKEHIAIVGPNGSGKSSLIKVIMREYYPVASPDVVRHILGRDLWNVADLRKEMGIVTTDLQNTCLRDSSVIDMVVSGFFSSIGIYESHDVTTEMMQKADIVLEELGISHLKKRLMTEISTGEARKVLIARALVHDPKALVLDEPTNSLDMKAISQFRKMISDLSGNHNIVLVTHDLSDIIPEIDRIILIKNGKIIADGRKDDILTGENLTKLFDVPVTVEKHGLYYSSHLGE
ncbi:ATP-binding cassette domain-containing protein [Methanosarcinaceae archaeon]|nr:ATP-binding cassette domain-containing protein [Methanosarcinaceae archaeon]MBQ3620766.1 ATP-binding cassette domain-containing protein [Methanosarcinaceae archaeon]